MKHKTLAAAVAAIVVGTALQLVYMRRFEAEVSGGDPLGVTVVARDVHAGDTLSADMLGTRQVPSAYVDLRNIRTQDRDALIGETLATAVRAGESLLWSDLLMDPTRDADLAARVRPGMRAVTLHAGGDAAFAELLRPGDRVDVLLSSSGDGAARVEGRTQTLLQNVLVLAVGADVGARVMDRSKVHRVARQVTVSVTPAGAQILTQAQLQGRLTLTLRNPDDAVLLTDAERAAEPDAISHVRPSASVVTGRSGVATRAIKEVDHVR